MRKATKRASDVTPTARDCTRRQRICVPSPHRRHHSGEASATSSGSVSGGYREAARAGRTRHKPAALGRVAPPRPAPKVTAEVGSSRADGCIGVSTGQFNARLPTTNFSEWAEVRAVATKSSLHFVDRSSLPSGIVLYTDDDEWTTWKKIGDEVLHIELRKWADIMVIAPLSANTLAKIAGGLCDNLLTCIVRAWDYGKPLFVAPAMNTFMWNNPFTERHLQTISQLGISLIPPVTKTLACGDYGNGAMAETSQIYAFVRLACKPRTHGTGSSHVIPVSNDLPSS